MHVELSRQTIRKLTFFGGLLGLLGSLFLSLLVGTVSVSPVELWQFLTSSPLANTGEFIYRLRVPRALNAALTGMNLALSGCILQGLVRNPLADPGIIGISAGAGMAAMLLMFLAPNLVFWVPIVAFIGAMGAAVLVFALAWNRGVQPLFLVLSGVAVSVFFGGGMTALSVFFSDQVQGTIGWMAGGFNGCGWVHVRMILPYSLLGVVGAMGLAGRLNALQLGDEVACMLGVPVKQTRTLLVMVAALLAASAVSVAGLLGFVGLIVPHVTRLLVGSDFKVLIPCSAVLGAGFVVITDMAARTLFNPVEVPVGIFMSFIGAPFFLYLLKRKMKR